MITTLDLHDQPEIETLSVHHIKYIDKVYSEGRLTEAFYSGLKDFADGWHAARIVVFFFFKPIVPWQLAHEVEWLPMISYDSSELISKRQN